MAQENVMQEATQGMQDKASGVMDNLKESVKPHVLVEKFHEWKYTLLDWSIYFGIGFFIGFVIKKYLKYLLLLVLFVVALVILEQFDILHLNVDWQKVQELLNIQNVSTEIDGQVWDAYWQWIRANLAIVVSSSIGFFIGVKVG